MRVVFAGTPEVALPPLDALVASRHQVVAVLTRPDAPRGRGRTLHPSPVATRADELGIEVLRPTHPRDPEFADRLRSLAVDCCPVVAYGALVPRSILVIPRYGWVNLHFSLLPAWRGAAPVQHALLAGDAVTGATTFRLVAAMDAGPIYDTVTEPIGPSTTAGELLRTLAHSGADLLVRTLDAIEDGTAQPTPQPETGVTLAGKIVVADARLDWERPAELLDRQIRACTPDPGAWALFRGDRFKIISASVVPPDGSDRLDQHGPPRPGELVADKHTVRVGTGTGALLLDRIQPPGKKPMSAADWARGVTMVPGERLD